MKLREAKKLWSEGCKKKEDSEIVKKGKKIALALKLSTESCCPKLFSALNPDIPETKHNKPLSQMARPMKALLEQFALVKNVKIGEMERKQWGVGGKKAMSEFIDY